VRHSYRDPGGCRSTVDLIEVDDDTWLISRVYTQWNERGIGAASRTLVRVCDDADREDVTLLIQVQPDDDRPGALSDEQLYSWYQRRGFVRTRSVVDGLEVMERTPR